MGESMKTSRGSSKSFGFPFCQHLVGFFIKFLLFLGLRMVEKGSGGVTGPHRG